MRAKRPGIGPLVALVLAGMGLVGGAAAADASDEVNQAVSALKAGDPDRALDLLTRAIGSGDLSKESLATAYYDRGAIYLSRHQFDAAAADYTAAIADNAKFAEAYIMRGNVRAAQRDGEGAIEDFSAALEISPGDANAALDLANAYRAAGQNDKAIAAYDTAVKNGSSAYAYEGRALARLSRRETDLAIADLGEAIRLKPDYAAAFVDRGNVYAAKGQYDLAISDFSAAIKIDPHDSAALTDRAEIYAKLGKSELAAADYAAAGEGGTTAYRALGDSLLTHKKYAEAVAQYDLALAKTPNDAEVLLNRGVCHQMLREFDRAIADYSAAIRAAPGDARAYNNRGGVYGAQGKLDLAIADFRKAVELDPTFADAKRNLEGATRAKKTGRPGPGQ